MQIKAADDKQPDINALEVLLSRQDVVGPKRRRIWHELRAIKAGERGEREAAYDIEFHYGANPNVMTIHDLRLECGGRVAQIDHLIITRRLQIWMCESKSVGAGVEINEYGEWMAYYGGGRVGIPSPIEQNKRHAMVLKDVLAKGLVTLPQRRGSRLWPEIKSVVLVSKSAGIARPRNRAVSRAEGLDYVIKSDQLHTTIARAVPSNSATAAGATIARETVENLARQLAALHSPARTDWASRFGLRLEEWADVPAIPLGPPRQHVRPAARLNPVAEIPVGARAVCASCGRSVSEAVVSYCRANATLFRGGIFCMACQQQVRGRHA